MRILIDTHIFLWALMSPEKLSPQIRQAIMQADQVSISSISFWEVSLKFDLGKLELKGLKPEDLPKAARLSGFNVIESDAQLLASSYQLPQIGHKDPFDRLIIHTAIQNQLTLISEDSAFTDYMAQGLKLFQTLPQK
jgi:PIN domain nuclease of toxin-antitoxin system